MSDTSHLSRITGVRVCEAALVHGGTTREDDVAVQILTDYQKNVTGVGSGVSRKYQNSAEMHA